jgi:hypothetical protein
MLAREILAELDALAALRKRTVILRYVGWSKKWIIVNASGFPKRLCLLCAVVFNSQLLRHGLVKVHDLDLCPIENILDVDVLPTVLSSSTLEPSSASRIAPIQSILDASTS